MRNVTLQTLNIDPRTAEAVGVPPVQGVTYARIHGKFNHVLLF
jgi:hypothetical protein